MRNLPVHWFEGMFLRPQHFQAADRHWNELIATSAQWDSAYNYGLRSVEVSPEALANYHVQISRCEAAMRDGTLVAFSGGQGSGSCGLKQAFERQSEVTVYLALPKWRWAASTSSAGGTAGHARFVSRLLPVQDETTGGNDQEIQFREVSLRLMLSTQELTGYGGAAGRTHSAGGRARGDTGRGRRLFSAAAGHRRLAPLGLDIVRAIYDIVGQKMEVLAARVAERGINLTSQEPGDLDDLLMLMVLNQAYSVLHCLTFAQGVHPFVAYCELCRVVGMLAIFDEAAADLAVFPPTIMTIWRASSSGSSADRAAAGHVPEAGLRAAVLCGDGTGHASGHQPAMVALRLALVRRGEWREHLARTNAAICCGRENWIGKWAAASRSI